MTKQNSKKSLLRMSWLLKGITLGFLLVTLSSEPLKAQSLPQPGPSGILYLDKFEQDNLAKMIKECDLNKKNLNSYQKAYEICSNKDELTPAWWQTTLGVTGISVGAFALGILVGSLK